MNKLILLLFSLFCLNLHSALAQDPVCVPDSTYADSLAGVYPGPFHETLFPDGGIHDTACINHPFELVLTAVVRDSITYLGWDVALNYLKVEDNGFLNLPAGLDYACNPPDCNFEANTLGCMLISGTPDATNEASVFDLELKVEIKIADLWVINDTLPKYLIPDSHYYLVLDAEDSAYCQQLNVNNLNGKKIDFTLLQNPVNDAVKISIDAPLHEAWKVDIVNMSGESLLIKNGYNSMINQVEDLKLDRFAPGYYFIRLITKEGIAIKKLIVLSE